MGIGDDGMSHDEHISQLLRNVDNNGRIISRERNDLEFKETYHMQNFPKYAKTMVSFANNRGGYIVFGIKDNPREIVGVNTAFNEIKLEEFTASLNAFFSPEIDWDLGIVSNDNTEVGYIYTYESINKPVIALKNENSARITNGDVFYRYRARTEKIKFPEMNRLILEKMKHEREVLLKHFEAIFKNGSTNVGIVDYTDGIVSTPFGVDVAVDRKLIMQVLKRARFIKEGSFNETSGQPVLKVTGNIELAEEVPVPDIEPDIQYPYLQKQIAEKLSISNYEVYALVWKYNMKDQRKFHMEFTTSSESGTKTHKFSDIAVQFLADKLNENKNNTEFISDIKNEFNNAKRI